VGTDAVGIAGAPTGLTPGADAPAAPVRAAGGWLQAAGIGIGIGSDALTAMPGPDRHASIPLPSGLRAAGGRGRDPDCPRCPDLDPRGRFPREGEGWWGGGTQRQQSATGAGAGAGGASGTAISVSTRRQRQQSVAGAGTASATALSGNVSDSTQRRQSATGAATGISDRVGGRALSPAAVPAICRCPLPLPLTLSTVAVKRPAARCPQPGRRPGVCNPHSPRYPPGR